MTKCVTFFCLLFMSSHFPSRFILLNVPNSMIYVCFFRQAYKMTISPIKTNCGRLSLTNGLSGLMAWSKSLRYVPSLCSAAHELIQFRMQQARSALQLTYGPLGCFPYILLSLPTGSLKDWAAIPFFWKQLWLDSIGWRKGILERISLKIYFIFWIVLAS